MNDVAAVEIEAKAEQEESLISLWQRLVQNPDSPDRAELTELGEIVVRPLPANRHQLIIGLVADQLKEQLGGQVIQNLAVLTRGDGVRCPDAAWLPADRLLEVENIGPMESAPPLVVEVLSPGIRKGAMTQKIRGYLQARAKEVIVVALNGKVTFHRKDGPHNESAMGVKLALPERLFSN